MKNKKKTIKIIIGILVVALIVGVYALSSAKPKEYRTYEVKKGNIKTVVSGSGTIGAKKSRKEYSKISAEITDIFFNEGDEVKAGDVIMKLDSSTYDNSIKSQMIAIEQAKLSKNTAEKQISDLKITANATGYINGLTIAKGDYITNATPVCDIVKESNYEVTLQFVYNQNALINVGNSAIVTILSSYSTLPGTVTKVSDMRKVISGNSQVVEVTIEVQTTGYSLDGISAKAEVNNGAVAITSVNQSQFSLVKKNTVRAQTMGTVAEVYVNNGSYVRDGEAIARLENVDLSTNLKNISLTLQNQYNQLALTKDQLDNYEIVSEIDGIITSMPYKVGDLVAAGSLLTSVSDRSVMEFKIPVDELDVAKLNKDQKVLISVDAIPETEATPIEGRISIIPLEGVTTAGITDYYVTIEFDGRDDVRISMNANADIVISDIEDVLTVPIDAITKENGISYVQVLEKDERGSDVVTTKEIKTGATDTTYMEVLSGLNEGEKVIIPETSSIYMPSASSMMQMRAN